MEGIPAEAIAIATIIDVIMDFLGTACCMTLLQLNLVIQEDKLKLLDKKKLRA